MGTTTAPAASTADREIVITRTFDAPRELVWDAWTDLKHIANWWGPKGFSTTTHAREFREGGTWRYTMHGPDGTDFLNRVTYREIARPERLVYSHGGEGEHEDIGFQATVTFEDIGGRTRVTMRSVFPSAAERDRVSREFGAVQGGIQHLGRLADHLARTGTKQRPVLTLALPTDREIILSRSFAAPRPAVFEAFTRPELLKQWWGLRGSTLAVCEIDLKPGGAWRFVLRGPDGAEHPFTGVFREIAPPVKLVRTLIYDVPMARDHEAIETLQFDEEDGKTILTHTVLHRTPEGRDGHLHSGMEPGAAETLDRLEELLRQRV